MGEEENGVRFKRSRPSDVEAVILAAVSAVRLAPSSAGSAEPVKVSAAAVTVMFAEPLKATPLIFRGVVNVPALPVVF